MQWKRALLSCFLILSAPAMAAEGSTAPSGLPIPRFVALKNAETNVRTGPGTRYPIQWVYRREHMPVEVIEEFEYWRKIRDMEGSSGWVHKTMLDGRRYVVINSKEARLLRVAPEIKAKPVLKIEPMVIARVDECEAEWCRLQLAGHKGWMEKKYLWGVYARESFD